MRFRIPGSTVANAEATNASYNQPLPWVRIWETNFVDGVYTVKVWNPVGTNQSAAWTVRVISRIREGSTVAWGNNSDGQTDYPAELTNTLAIAAGDFHSVAVREDGGVAQWGHSWAGIPSNLTNAIAGAAGSQHTVALRNDGTVVCWGTNTLGQTNTPAGLTNVIAVAAGGNQSLALRKDGSVTNWGQVFAAKPASATNVIAIACGTNFNLALKSNATLVAWGNNSNGQTNVPASATNVVSIAAGGSHALALKLDGTVVAWGSNASGQTNVPAGLSNVMAVAAGWTHSVALKNDGTVICWGDNTYGQTNAVFGLGNVKFIAAGGNTVLAAIFSPLVQYPVDVTKDLLLIYNTNSADSIVVKNYYLAHRPLVTGANVLGIGCTNLETFLPDEYTNVFAAQVQGWLTNNPTKRPQYVILFPGIPSRVNTNNTPGVHDYPYGFKPSVQYQLHSWCSLGWHPFVTSINMRGTNDCRAYIDKLAGFGATNSPGKLIISASAGTNYGNTNYVVDNIRHGYGYEDIDDNYADSGGVVWAATNGLMQSGVPTNAILYADGLETITNSTHYDLPHLTNAVNVAGYISWGFHSSLGSTYAVDGKIKWGGNSAWYIVETIESFNGYATNFISGTFVWWFGETGFGGTNYSNTPVGALSYVDEPLLPPSETASTSFGLWAGGKNLAICIWNSTSNSRIQVVGDPLVAR